MESATVYFDKPGSDNTAVVFDIARKRAAELGIKSVIVASTSGETGVKAVEAFKGLKTVVVSHAAGDGEPNVQWFKEDSRRTIISKGGTVVTMTPALSGISKAMRKTFNTAIPGETIAATLQIFGAGMKVVCEIAVMAADSGEVNVGEEAICIAGTGHGADTAVVLSPANVGDFFNLKVKEILCKPRL